MMPGRFPSCEPSDTETTLFKSVETSLQLPPMVESNPISPPDYTAPFSLRTQPRFAGLPIESLLASSSAYHSTSRPVGNNRRVSDTLHNRPQTLGQSSGSPIRKPKQRRLKRAKDSRAEPASNRRNSSDQPSTSPDTTDQTLDSSPKTPQGTETSSENPDLNGKAPESDQHPSLAPQPSASPRPIKSPQIVHSKLITKLHQPVTPSSTRGVVYILRNPLLPSLGLKIGSTIDLPTRLQWYRTKCKFPPQLIFSYSVEYYDRTEKLAHADLAYVCRPYVCGCGTEHREWFGVSESVAIETVKRWVGFMERERPYGWRGQLGWIWKFLVEKRSRVRGSKVRVDEGGDHVERWKQWESILAAPSVFDYADAIVHLLGRWLERCMQALLAFWTFASTFFWQISTMLYGFLTVAYFQNMLASVIFAGFLVCACFSMYGTLSLKAPKKRGGRS